MLDIVYTLIKVASNHKIVSVLRADSSIKIQSQISGHSLYGISLDCV